MVPVDKAEKQNATAKKRPVKSPLSVPSGEPQKNTAVAVIFNNEIGGDAGMFISRQMDEQAMELGKEKLSGGRILRIGEGIKITYDGNMMFAGKGASLSETAQNDLRRITETLKTFDNTDIIIEGHTDGAGTTQSNLEMSRARAKAVADFLMSQNIKAGRIKTIGYGEGQPLFSNDTEEGRRQNKRIEIVIIADDQLRAAAKKQ